MITIIPITIRGAMVTSSTVPYPDTGETAWVTSTAYAVGDTVSYLIGDLYHKFECIQAHTSDSAKLPEAFPDDETNAYWIDLGAVNKYKMFQLERSGQTVETTSPLTVEVDPGEMVGSVALDGLVGDDVTLEVYNTTPTLVKTETKSLLDRVVTDWYDWTYKPYRQVSKTVFNDLPLDPTYTFKIIITRATGDVKCGAVVAGVPFEIGKTLVGTDGGFLNFSSFDRTFDGETKIRLRQRVPENKHKLFIKKEKFNATLQMFADLNGVVTVWMGLSDTVDDYFESTFIVGLYKDFDYSIEEHGISASALIEGI